MTIAPPAAGASRIDHLVINAPSLVSGAAFVRNALGVEPQAGGEHPRMGTHNLLLRLGDTAYLEVIAPNPAAPHPNRPRWFGLDDVAADSAPRLASWAARTPDIRATAAAASEALGEVEAMSRGDLAWLITIPRDGQPVLDGTAPALIEWPAGGNPATRLVDRGCALSRLEAFHPEPDRLVALFETLGLADAVPVSRAPIGVTRGWLVARIDTPAGPRSISGRWLTA